MEPHSREKRLDYCLIVRASGRCELATMSFMPGR